MAFTENDAVAPPVARAITGQGFRLLLLFRRWGIRLLDYG